jgi:riboflavin synthase
VFTGIVEELGSVVSIDAGRLRIAASTVLEDVSLGASIAVNGCCLTVVDWEPPAGADTPGWWDADVSEETLARTDLGKLGEGDPVNLERPVRLEDRMGGHLVQGHVDAVGTVRRPAPDLEVTMPAELSRYVVEKGSITVDGVSLTVVDARPDSFTVAVIPHTTQVTTLGQRGIGDGVNLEVDVMAKYTESLIAAYLPGGLTKEDPNVA